MVDFFPFPVWEAWKKKEELENKQKCDFEGQCLIE